MSRCLATELEPQLAPQQPETMQVLMVTGSERLMAQRRMLPARQHDLVEQSCGVQINSYQDAPHVASRYQHHLALMVLMS